ncbi:MAG: hypothetical protein FWE56_04625 [Candidatus Bathyarchaeota archaeon]|nr:hypothetical protein [Candidatus Termiticorpusculum sp.]MCL2868890.1 hypothetical protein [Candidatus Termiticorpusculum sp.]
MNGVVVVGPKFSNGVWGVFLLLAAAFVLSSQFIGFTEIGIGSIIVAVLALAFMVQCIARLSFAPLPIPLALLYVIFQNPLGLPYVNMWILLTAAVLASIGLYLILPRRHRSKGSRGSCSAHHKHGYYVFNEQERSNKTCTDKEGDEGYNNNPIVNVSFGTVSRRLYADCLETVQLDCNFGELSVFFDQVQLNPKGAEATLTCSFGTIVIYVPKHWRIIDKIGCTLGEVSNDNCFASPTENVPQLTIKGNVSLGKVEIRYAP